MAQMADAPNEQEFQRYLTQVWYFVFLEDPEVAYQWSADTSKTF